MDPFSYRHDLKWLRAWRADYRRDSLGRWEYQWQKVYDGFFKHAGVVRTYTAPPGPGGPYYVVEVWERDTEESPWRRTLNKANWDKGAAY